MPAGAAAPASQPADADPIAAAHAAFDERFESIASGETRPVEEKPAAEKAEQEPKPGEAAKDTPGQGSTADAERPTGQPEPDQPKSTEPQSKPEEGPEKDPEAKPDEGKPKDKAPVADRLKADPELDAHVQRLLQSERDKTQARLNKQARAQNVRQSNSAFATDWETMPSEDKDAWLSADPAVQQWFKGQVAETAGALAADLMDLLGVDQGKLTQEMLAPEGRDALRGVLLDGTQVAAKYETVRKEAFAAGEAAARAKLRGQEKAPPTGDAAPPVEKPKDLAGARSVLEARLDQMGF